MHPNMPMVLEMKKSGVGCVTVMVVGRVKERYGRMKPSVEGNVHARMEVHSQMVTSQYITCRQCQLVEAQYQPA